MVNHEMNERNFKEGVAFDGLVPAFVEEYEIDTVGASNVVVKEFGREAMGMDALEVIDVQKAME